MALKTRMKEYRARYQMSQEDLADGLVDANAHKVQ